MEVAVAVLAVEGSATKGRLDPSSLRLLLREPHGSSRPSSSFIPEAGTSSSTSSPSAPLRLANPRTRGSPSPTSRRLPQTSVPLHTEPSSAEVARRLALSLLPSASLCGFPVRVRVPDAASAASAGPALYAVALAAVPAHTGPEASSTWERLDGAVHLAVNGHGSLDAAARHQVLLLEEWLRWAAASDPAFLPKLFRRKRAAARLRHSIQSPAHPSAHLGPRPSEASGWDPSTLEEAKRRANEANAAMMAVEKCDVFILNPLFGFPLPYRLAKGATLVTYAAKGRRLPSPEEQGRGRGLSEGLPSGSSAGSGDSNRWADEFPIHYAAYLGRPERIRTLLTQGAADPNLPDPDSWLPIHYAAWYGQLGSMRTLLNFGSCAVNARTRNGSTALHFAAWCGRAYLVELLLSHPEIEVEAVDSSGKTALDFCECVPKPEWQDCGRLLRAARAKALPKVGVELADGSNVMVSLLRGPDTTAAELHCQVADELGLTQPQRRLFALWIASASLQLQLGEQHKPMGQLGKWKTKILPKWSETPDPEAETPTLIFRRDAKCSLAYEKKVEPSEAVISLLYAEAQGNFLRGLYPCAESDTVLVAALTLQILHGNYSAAATKGHLANERTLSKILPLGGRTKASVVAKVAAEHKDLSSRLAKTGQRSISALQYQLVSLCWRLRVYGSAFFPAIVFMTKPVAGAMGVVVGVNDEGLHLLHQDSNELAHSYPLGSLRLTHQADKPFLEVRSKASGPTSASHAFTLRTRQAANIATLVRRLSEPRKGASEARRDGPASSKTSSRSDLSHNSAGTSQTAP